MLVECIHRMQSTDNIKNMYFYIFGIISLPCFINSLPSANITNNHLLLAISDYYGLLLTITDNYLLLLTISNYYWLLLTISDYFWLLLTIWVVREGLKGTAQLYSALILEATFLKRRHVYRFCNIFWNKNFPCKELL